MNIANSTLADAVAAESLRRHDQFRDHKRLHVAITGSRGLIGTELTHFLVSGGHRVTRLVSGEVPKPAPNDDTIWKAWNPQEPLPEGMLDGIDALINLAGDNIASGRWTAFKKEKLRSSRVVPTRHLATAVTRDEVPAFLSSSALGIYGNRGDEVLTEASPPGHGFLVELAMAWEAAAKCDARVVLLRTGIVLSTQGGALAKQLTAFRLGGGAVLGDGTQFVSWIDLMDMVFAIHHLLMTQTCNGPINLSAPNPVTNRVFGRSLASVLHRPYLLTVPRFALRLLFGDMTDEALLASTNAAPAKLIESGYKFFQPALDGSLRLLLSR